MKRDITATSYPMTIADRIESMQDRYGEVVTITQASKILNVCSRTVTRMLDDGRISWACGGTRVDVPSIAAYIQAPAAAMDNVKFERRKAKCEGRWCV